MSQADWAEGASLALSLGVQVTYPTTDSRPGREGGRLVEATILPPFRLGYLDSDGDTGLEDGLSSHSSSSSIEERNHEYKRLKFDEIRLLVLNPGMPNDPIECYLEHYPVSQTKPYEALSYVWGDTQDSYLIQLDGCPFKVTENLKNFLVSYRPMIYVPSSG
jgi:hypothetical protein